ncbi:uncharacterized protein LY89DRAFT_682855 [Mollisia scopiformis]|uniref:Uncharacterized protein n=1 Tax=Mollisia scopiformis TaxID=149040 RepID=A0A194XJU1_MOLSC|nr:uncharacterized protein LY89DRAFT_682855 [Mollisia scopiformis]KUJ20052.1 hypothetical protein LY89DRAFT_682855 [Mollisia scopiformis]
MVDEVEVQYPLALANVLISLRKAGGESKEGGGAQLRFLFVSGTFSERDQGRRLWFLEQGRMARVSCSLLCKGVSKLMRRELMVVQGLAENRLFNLAEQNPDIFEAVAVKAAYVVPKKSKVPDVVVGLSRNAIRVDELDFVT